VKEEVGNEDVVACAKVHVSQGHRRIGALFLFISYKKDSLCKLKPFLVPAIEVSGFDLGLDLEYLREIGAAVWNSSVSTLRGCSDWSEFRFLLPTNISDGCMKTS
jgi:hypothetical protein